MIVKPFPKLQPDIELPNGFLGVGGRVRCFVKAKDIPDHFPMERIKGVAGVS